MAFAHRSSLPDDTNEMLRHMVDAVEDYAIYLLDTAGTVISWNSGAQRHKGYSGDEIVGRNYACFFTRDAIDGGLPAYQLEQARAHGRFRGEGWRVRKDGTTFWAEVILTALRNDAGVLIGFTKITRDLTVWREQAESLRIAKEEAEKANQSKSEFLANMSHELRTPLNAIIGFSELLSSEKTGSLGTDKNREYVAHILHSGRLLLALINDILDLAKLDAKAVKLAIAPVALGSLAQDMIELMQPEAEKAGVAVRIDVADTACVPCDPTRVRQMLLNLLSNAVKFTPYGGQVSLIVVDEGSQVKVRVCDTGIGIAADDIPRAMARFGQIDNSLSRKTPGTGLGLPLVKELVELHGGALQLESKPGIGTNVTLVFPKNRVAP